MRNQSLATIAAASSNFKGANEKLPIIGKRHENGVSSEKFINEVASYVAVEFDEGNDLELILLKQEDDYEKASGLQKPTITEEDMKRADLMSLHNEEVKMYLRRKHLYINLTPAKSAVLALFLN